MFLDSSLKEVKPYRFYEQATALPAAHFPMYIGSGECVLSLDSTGMQGANNLFQDAFAGANHIADMYTVGHGIMAKGVNIFFDERYWGENINTLPFGWLDYTIDVDGITYEPQDIIKNGAVFSRDMNLKCAQVVVSYILNSEIKVEIKAMVPYGTCAPVFAFRMRSYDRYQNIAEKSHKVTIKTRLHLNVRGNGEPLFDSVDWNGNHITVKKKGYKDYCLHYTLSNSQNAQMSHNDLTASMDLTFETKNEWSSWQYMMYSFDGANTVDDLPELTKVHLAEWKRYFERISYIETGKPEEEYLYNHSMYLYHMAYNMDYSIQLGHPFYFLGCWQACTFWDTVFAVDALCRMNDRESVDKVLRYYRRIMRKEGKPFTWMTIFDGHTFMDPKKDNAPLVISAVAMMAIRHYEFFKDETFLKECLYPIIENCARYAAQAMFTQNEKGGWYVSMPVSNDVVDEEGEEVNQTFTTLWFATVLRKAYEYGTILGTPVERFREISDNIYLEHTDEEYLHSKGFSAAQWRWASWIPFILYPTEGEPFVDMELCQKTLDKYTYTDLYMEKQNSWQPWTECIEAQSRNRAGRTEEAYQLLREAMKHTFGAGYFSEIGPQQPTVAYPPYVSAHSAFVAAYADQFATASIWEKKIKLFFASEAYSSNRIELRNVRCAKNVLITKAVRRRDSVSVALTGDLRDTSVEIRLPADMDVHTVCVYVNGKVQEFTSIIRKHSIQFLLEENQEALIEVM